MFRSVLSVFVFLTGHFVVVPLTWPHQLCLHHFFFEHSSQNLLNFYDYGFSLSHTCVFLKSTIEVVFAINVGNRLLLPFLIHKSIFMLNAIASSKYVQFQFGMLKSGLRRLLLNTVSRKSHIRTNLLTPIYIIKVDLIETNVKYKLTTVKNWV